MNKTVVLVGVVFLGLSLIMTVVGTFASGSGIDNLENIDDSPSPYYTNSSNGSVTFTFIDEDDAGSVPFEVLVGIDYIDEDEDGFVDGCEQFDVKVTDESGTDVTEYVLTRGCKYDVYTAEDPIHDGLVVHTYVCDTYYGDAECNVDSNYTVSVMMNDTGESVDFILFDNDAYMIMILGAAFSEVGELLGGLGIASCGCCGVGLGLIILIIGLVMGGGQAPQTMMQPVSGQAVAGVDAQMGQPVEQQGYIPPPLLD